MIGKSVEELGVYVQGKEQTQLLRQEKAVAFCWIWKTFLTTDKFVKIRCMANRGNYECYEIVHSKTTKKGV